MKTTLKENLKPLFFIGVVLILTAISAYPQRKFGGKVVEVIDGKTCVIQMGSGKLTAVLQYIEIPETDQPLYGTVREHLQNIVLNQQIEFLPRIVMNDRTVGQLLMKGVDVGQQMLRDGAAWYSIPEKSGQNSAESLVYQNNETQAKAEKRGVWSVANLKPSWEFRAEKEEKRKREEKIALETAIPNTRTEQSIRKKVMPVVQPSKQLSGKSSLWEQVDEEHQFPKGTTNADNLNVVNSTSGRTGMVGTPPLRYEIIGDDNSPEMTIAIACIYSNEKLRGEKDVYFIQIESRAEKFSFSKDNNLLIKTDKENFSIKPNVRAPYQKDGVSLEILTYYITRSFMEKLSKTKDIQFKVGKYSGIVNGDISLFLQNILQIAPK
jgi:endonuclease YncB( thermonuclease family)